MLFLKLVSLANVWIFSLKLEAETRNIACKCSLRSGENILLLRTSWPKTFVRRLSATKRYSRVFLEVFTADVPLLTKCYSKTVEWWNHVIDLGVDERIILKEGSLKNCAWGCNFTVYAEKTVSSPFGWLLNCRNVSWIYEWVYSIYASMNVCGG